MSKSAATKEEVREIVKEIVMEASDAILTGLGSLISQCATKEDLKRVEVRVSVVETDVSFIKRDVVDRKAESFNTVSKPEFNQLEKRVTRLENRIVN